MVSKIALMEEKSTLFKDLRGFRSGMNKQRLDAWPFLESGLTNDLLMESRLIGEKISELFRCIVFSGNGQARSSSEYGNSESLEHGGLKKDGAVDRRRETTAVDVNDALRFRDGLGIYASSDNPAIRGIIVGFERI